MTSSLFVSLVVVVSLVVAVVVAVVAPSVGLELFNTKSIVAVVVF